MELKNAIDEEFINFYNQAIIPEMKRCVQIKDTYKNNKLPIKIFAKVTVIMAFITYVMFEFVHVVFIFMIPFLTMIALIMFSNAYMSANADNAQKEINIIIRQNILLPVYRYFFPNVVYKPNQKFQLNTVKKSLLIDPIPSSISGSDYIKIETDNAIIQFCDTVCMTNIKSTFNGIFCITTFNKNFSGTTVIYSKSDLSLKQKVKHFLNLSDDTKEIVSLDSIKFMEQFTVISDNPIEAHYLLTPSFMERILAYQKKIGQSISLSFVDNRLYIKIPISTNAVNYDIVLKPLFKLLINNQIKFFVKLTSIVEDLKLGTKMWSQQYLDKDIL